MEMTVMSRPCLRDCVGRPGRQFAIAGATLAEALRAVRVQYPLLRVHVWDETEHLRPHVLHVLQRGKHPMAGAGRHRAPATQ